MWYINRTIKSANFQMLVMNCDNNNFYRTICTVFELLNHRFSCQRKRVKVLKFVFIVSTRMYTGNTVSMLDWISSINVPMETIFKKSNNIHVVTTKKVSLISVSSFFSLYFSLKKIYNKVWNKHLYRTFDLYLIHVHKQKSYQASLVLSLKITVRNICM